MARAGVVDCDRILEVLNTGIVSENIPEQEQRLGQKQRYMARWHAATVRVRMRVRARVKVGIRVTVTVRVTVRVWAKVRDMVRLRVKRQGFIRLGMPPQRRSQRPRT